MMLETLIAATVFASIQTPNATVSTIALIIRMNLIAVSHSNISVMCPLKNWYEVGNTEDHK